ncbi:DUF1697 domain-containing protein [Zafaria sp. Z1313]|uniref:DUF1697 domain-containing protein n=1 Tax=unclassified Zafaria TaxID=2828765 RepID=UPI002E797DC7|nr:DUF1697 domain-containing protein [Zafaria sp. J156]MEE1621547.1 DUF1697 domain-containing protein [Zafaria sp. J156]
MSAPVQHRYAVFLRGINVGGIRIKMKDLAAALTAAGFTGVATFLASGNVVLGSDADPADGGAEHVKSAVESTLREAFGYEAWVVVFTPGELTEIVDGYPFEAPSDGVPHHDYAVLTTGEDVAAALAAEMVEPSPIERVATGRLALYWQVPKGASLETAVARASAKSKLATRTTTRNLKTLRRVLAAC